MRRQTVLVQEQLQPGPYARPRQQPQPARHGREVDVEPRRAGLRAVAQGHLFAESADEEGPEARVVEGRRGEVGAAELGGDHGAEVGGHGGAAVVEADAVEELVVAREAEVEDGGEAEVGLHVGLLHAEQGVGEEVLVVEVGVDELGEVEHGADGDPDGGGEGQFGLAAGEHQLADVVALAALAEDGDELWVADGWV